MSVIPISVLTARSDTMDSVLAALCVADACGVLGWRLESGRVRWILLAALIMGVAFNVKADRGAAAATGARAAVVVGEPRSREREPSHSRGAALCSS